jgi:hypothetical protein
VAAAADVGVHCLLAPGLMVGDYEECLALLTVFAVYPTNCALLSLLLLLLQVCIAC